MAQLRKEETQRHKELTKYAELLGREKRIKMLKDSAKEFRAEAAKARPTNTALISATQQKEHDWATHGGIASAIAGPAAGVARAVELQAKNAEIRAQNQANMRMVAPAVMAMSGKASDYERYAQEEEAAAKEAETKLVDDTIPADELLSKIVFSDTTVEISDTGAFTVKVHAKKKEDLFVYDDTPATVDGTIAAELEQNGKVVGTALLVLPSHGVRNSNLTGICLSGAKKGVDYKVNFKPYHLWMMEI